MRSFRMVHAAASLVLALVVAGCAGSRAGGNPPTTTTADSVVETGAAQPAAELVRMTGAVVSGTEPGCFLLDTGFTRYVLIGGDQAELMLAVETEEQVTVTGQAYSRTPTTCTGGTPLEIQEIVPAT